MQCKDTPSLGQCVTLACLGGDPQMQIQSPHMKISFFFFLYIYNWEE